MKSDFYGNTCLHVFFFGGGLGIGEFVNVVGLWGWVWFLNEHAL